MLEVQLSLATVIAALVVIAAIAVVIHSSRSKLDEIDVRRRALRVLMGASSVPTAIALASSDSVPVCVALVCWCIVAIRGFKYLFPISARGPK